MRCQHLSLAALVVILAALGGADVATEETTTQAVTEEFSSPAFMRYALTTVRKEVSKACAGSGLEDTSLGEAQFSAASRLASVRRQIERRLLHELGESSVAMPAQVRQTVLALVQHEFDTVCRDRAPKAGYPGPPKTDRGYSRVPNATPVAQKRPSAPQKTEAKAAANSNSKGQKHSSDERFLNTQQGVKYVQKVAARRFGLTRVKQGKRSKGKKIHKVPKKEGKKLVRPKKNQCRLKKNSDSQYECPCRCSSRNAQAEDKGQGKAKANIKLMESRRHRHRRHRHRRHRPHRHRRHRPHRPHRPHR